MNDEHSTPAELGPEPSEGMKGSLPNIFFNESCVSAITTPGPVSISSSGDPPLSSSNHSLPSLVGDSPTATPACAVKGFDGSQEQPSTAEACHALG